MKKYYEGLINNGRSIVMTIRRVARKGSQIGNVYETNYYLTPLDVGEGVSFRDMVTLQITRENTSRKVGIHTASSYDIVETSRWSLDCPGDMMNNVYNYLIEWYRDEFSEFSDDYDTSLQKSYRTEVL